MIGDFWNLRGISKKGMAACLTNIIKDHGLDFICLMETMKSEYNEKFFQRFDPSDIFFWKLLPSNGKSGGILVGIRKESLDVSAVRIRKHLVQVNLWDKKKKCQWALLAVYGPAYEELKDNFLAEMAAWCNMVSMPYIIGGDFNIIRNCGEKNKMSLLPHSSSIFNSVIQVLGLREITMTGGKFTWSNNQNPPTLLKLDKVLLHL